MRFGIALVSGIFAVLAVALMVQVFPGVGFVWLDEALFVGYILGGRVALAPVFGVLPLALVGVGASLLAWRWAQGVSGWAAFWRGVGTALGFWLLAVAISNPFLGMFRIHMGDALPEPVARVLTSPGWMSVVESLWGHLLFGVVLGIFLWLGSYGNNGSGQQEGTA